MVRKCDQAEELKPVYEVVLLQVAAAEGDVSGHVEKLQHGERRGLTLETDTHGITFT